jgi:hypothetical protein
MIQQYGPRLASGPGREKHMDHTIENFLTQHSKEYYCDRCLSQHTSVEAPNAVKQIARFLVVDGTYSRLEAPCAGCGKKRTSTAYLGDLHAAAS